MSDLIDRRGIKCCHHCEDRFLGCHDVCPTYLQAKEEWQAAQATIRKAKGCIRNFDHHHFYSVLKQQKRNENSGKVNR